MLGLWVASFAEEAALGTRPNVLWISAQGTSTSGSGAVCVDAAGQLTCPLSPDAAGPPGGAGAEGWVAPARWPQLARCGSPHAQCGRGRGPQTTPQDQRSYEPSLILSTEIQKGVQTCPRHTAGGSRGRIRTQAVEFQGLGLSVACCRDEEELREGQRSG